MTPVLRLLTVAAFVAGIAVQFANPPNGDVSWLLTVGERMLAGEQLYSDIYELNPPMAALLYLPWAWLGQRIGVAPEIILPVALAAFVWLSTWLAGRTLAQSALLPQPGLFGLIVVTSLMLLPGEAFAEREHFAAIAILPLLAAAAVRANGATPDGWARLAAGIGAGLAMCIKPHFALAVLLPALFGAWRARSLRPIFNAEHVLAGVVVLGFWALTWLAFPAFFSNMLPLAGAAYLGSPAPFAALLMNQGVLPLWCAVVVLAVLYRKEAATLPAATWLAGAAGFYLAYLLQAKGFAYHLMPALILVAEVLALVVLGRATRAKNLTLAAVLAVIAAPAVPSLAGDRDSLALIRLLQPLGPNLRIANISPHLGVGAPLQRTIGATLVNSGPFLWIALGALRRQLDGGTAEKLANARALEQRERDMLRADLLRAPPDIVLTGRDAFDWYGWARVDPEVDALLRDYELLASVPTEEGYPVLVYRRPSAAR